MFVILTYDVGVKRNSKVLKTCRRYLMHVQKSVFEGYITDKQLLRLKNSLEKLIDTEEDQIAIYRYSSGGTIEKDIIGYHILQQNII